MNDNNGNVTYLKPKLKLTEVDDEAATFFMEGASQYEAYQNSEAFSAAMMNGILNAAQKKLNGFNNDNFGGDAAVIAVLIQGFYMRQLGVECPETHLLDDLRVGLTRKETSE